MREGEGLQNRPPCRFVESVPPIEYAPFHDEREVDREPLQDQECGRRSGVKPGVDHLDNVRVFQLAERPCLPLEDFSDDRVVMASRREELQRHLSVLVDVVRLKHLGHARSDGLLHTVAAGEEFDFWQEDPWNRTSFHLTSWVTPPEPSFSARSSSSHRRSPCPHLM